MAYDAQNTRRVTTRVRSTTRSSTRAATTPTTASAGVAHSSPSGQPRTVRTASNDSSAQVGTTTKNSSSSSGSVTRQHDAGRLRLVEGPVPGRDRVEVPRQEDRHDRQQRQQQPPPLAVDPHAEPELERQRAEHAEREHRDVRQVAHSEPERLRAALDLRAAVLDQRLHRRAREVVVGVEPAHRLLVGEPRVGRAGSASRAGP